MADYFTSDHFKLLNKWKGQKRDESNPEQNRAYEELKKAYEVTEAWARAVQEKMFPHGTIEVRKRPTNQGNNFANYNWAKIYPLSEAPKELAYTVGIDSDDGFVVKIDTVGLDDDSALREKYLKIREDDAHSPIVAILPAEEGLTMSLADLTAWSVQRIGEFTLTYEQVCEMLGLGTQGPAAHHQEPMIFKNGAHGRELPTPPPKQKGHCMDVWVVCELLREDHGHAPTREEVQGDRRLRQSNINNVSQEFYRWRRWRNEGGNSRQADSEQEKQTAASHQEPQAAMTAKGKTINRIYYGPPGTGKTYEMSKLLKREYEQATASIPLETWREQLINTEIASLTWWEAAAAALYELGGESKVAQLYAHPFVQAIAAAKGRNKNVKQTLWGTLQHHTVEQSSTVKIKLRLAPAVFDKSEDSVWRFAGTWEEDCADVIDIVKRYKQGPPPAGTVTRYGFVTFHQSYGYEEFVEGLRPVLDGDGEAGEIQYEIRSGVFKDLCRRARSAPDLRFAMVIDEINRGNISKIFGELITMIEPDKREGAENAISVTLPFSGESFSVPANVDIIGTMNTADRSLALLDTALRRRFEFVPVMPDARDEPGAPLAGLRVSSGEQVIDVPRMLDAINRRVEALYDRDHCIGHAYFTSLAKVPDGDERLVALQQVFSTRILPLLEEYFFEDWQKIRLVLADNQKPEAAQFVSESADHEDDLARLFGDDHGLDSYATKRRYAVQDAAFSNPDAYIGIYVDFKPKSR